MNLEQFLVEKWDNEMASMAMRITSCEVWARCNDGNETKMFSQELEQTKKRKPL
jgi:hypothetical protein